MTSSLIQRFYNVFPRAQLVNLYGPTEASIEVSYHDCSDTLSAKPVPIGKPIANVTLQVLNENHQLLPIGVSGMLHIGGIALAQGYWKQPERTNQYFQHILLPNTTEAQRFYATGDQVRRDKQGRIIYLGRMDDQIKWHGVRIETQAIERALESHNAVEYAIVRLIKDLHQQTQLAAYCVVPSLYSSNSEQDPLHKVTEWKQLYDQIYTSTSDTTSTTPMAYAGWKNSFTGQNFSSQTIDAWAQQKLASILAVSGERILEIGCGTGLLCLPLLKHCSHYTATDSSERALHILKERVPEEDRSRITLQHMPAHIYNEDTLSYYDLVILNSVIQYFPSMEYLSEVLQGAIHQVAKGGKIFLGDVRSLRHLKLFHTLLQHSVFTDDPKSNQQRIQASCLREEELLVDHSFFHYLRKLHPRITAVALPIPTGNDTHEMNLFRYDVVLYLDTPPTDTLPFAWTPWLTTYNRDTITQHLEKGESVIAFTQVPHEHFLRIQQQPLLPASERAANLDKLLKRHETECTPQLLQAIAVQYGYQLYITWSQAGESMLDLVYYRESSLLPLLAYSPPTPCRTPKRFTNDPLYPERSEKLLSTLRQHLTEMLPRTMIPSAMFLLEELPTKSSGKLDVSALPIITSMPSPQNYTAPRNELEKYLANLWSDLLHQSPIGVYDNFLDLGGHSLSVIQMLSHIHKKYNIPLSVHDIFQASNIAALAQKIQALQSNATIAKINSRRTSCLVCLQKGNPELPALFLVHPVGGTLFCFYPLVQALHIANPIYGIQDPAITAREMLFDDIHAMANYYRTQIVSLQPQGPYLLAGASFGGTVCVEIAHQLHAQEKTVGFLGVFDSWAFYTKTFTDKERLKTTLMRQYQWTKEKLANADIPHPEHWMDLYYHRLMMNIRYLPQPVHTPLTLFKAESLFAEFAAMDSPDNHWQKYCTHKINSIVIPGDHESILLPPNVDMLAQALRRAIENKLFLQHNNTISIE